MSRKPLEKEKRRHPTKILISRPPPFFADDRRWDARIRVGFPREGRLVANDAPSFRRLTQAKNMCVGPKGGGHYVMIVIECTV